MPKIYTEKEKENIRKALKREAGKCLALYGVRKTTVDELVRRVDIPKGTFYLFYESKEALFFDLLVTYADEVESDYLSMLQEIDENHIVTSLTDIFYTLLIKFYDEGLYRFLDGAELELVLRRLPDKSLPDISKRMSTVIHNLFSYFYIDDKEDIKSFEAGYEALLYLLLSADRLKDKENMRKRYLQTGLLVRGLVLQMVE